MLPELFALEPGSELANHNLETKSGVADCTLGLLSTGNDDGLDAPGAIPPAGNDNGGVSAAGASAELVCEPCKYQQRYVPTKL